MSTTQDVIKGRLRSLEESLQSTEEHRVRLVEGIRRARRMLRTVDLAPETHGFHTVKSTLTVLDNTLAAVDRRRRDG